MVSLRFWLPLLVLLVATACRSETNGPTTSSGGSGAGGELPDPLPLTVVNWNLFNFYNDEIDDSAQDEAIDPNWTVHRADVGKVLRAIDGDILVLQEVEHEAVLEELDALELDGAYPYIRVIDGNDPRGIDVGIMSKIPLDEVKSHKDESFTKAGTDSPPYLYARDCLEVHVTYNGRALALLGVHYKAKENDNPDKRLAEAQHTREIADALSAATPQKGVLILGDFNDIPGSPPYLATAGDAGEFTNSAESVPSADQWTFDYFGTLELVDHQFANPLMAARLDEIRILHGPEAEAASDHAPVIATYQVN